MNRCAEPAASAAATSCAAIEATSRDEPVDCFCVFSKAFCFDCSSGDGRLTAPLGEQRDIVGRDLFLQRGDRLWTIGVAGRAGFGDLCVEFGGDLRGRRGRRAGQRDEAAHAFADRFFAGDGEGLNVGRVFEVCAAAEFDGEFPPLGVCRVFEQFVDAHADRNDPHHRRIFLAEDGAQAVDFERLILRRELCVNRQIFSDPLIDERFDVADFVFGEGFAVREVETELVRIDERAFLLNAVAEDFAESPVGNVGGGVILLGAGPHARERGRDMIADAQVRFDHVADVQHISAGDAGRRDVHHRTGFGAQLAGVTDLPAHFGIKVGLIENDGNALPCRFGAVGAVDQFAAVPDGFDGCADRSGVEFGGIIRRFHAGLIQLRQHIGRQFEQHRRATAPFAAGDFLVLLPFRPFRSRRCRR